MLVIFSFCFRYMLQYFAERGFGFRDVDDNLQTPLHHACSFGHLEAFKFLMRNGVGVLSLISLYILKPYTWNLMSCSSQQVFILRAV